MTSPTIIRSPGAIDEAAAAFQQAFVISNQLARQRQQLQIEQQKAASQINLEGAQANEAKARTKGLEQQAEDLANQEAGHRLATAHIADLNNDNAFAQDLQNVDPAVGAYALTFRDQLRKASSDVALQTAQTGEAQQRIDAQKRDLDENNRIGQLIATADTSSPNALATLARRIGAINPAKMGMVTALEPKGNYTFFHGPDGQLYIGDTKRGTATRTEYNVGQPAGAGLARQNQQKLAAGMAYNAIRALDQIGSKYGIDATGIPVAASAAQGVANLGAFGVKPFGGLAGPAAQRLRSQVQQDAANYNAMLIHSLATSLGGYRSIALMNSMGTAYTAQAGQDRQTLQNLNETRKRLLPALQAIMRGEQLDITQMPGFDKWGKDLIAEQQGQGEPNVPEATDADLDSFTPRPQQ